MQDVLLILSFWLTGSGSFNSWVNLGLVYMDYSNDYGGIQSVYVLMEIFILELCSYFFFFYHIFKEIVYLQSGLEKFSFNLLRGKQIDPPRVFLLTSLF